MQGQPFYYFAYGAAVSEVVVDTLTGEWKLLARRRAARRRPLAQPGDRHRPGRRRLHPGHGLADDGRAGLASERRHARAGLLLTHAPSTYKIPTANDCPPVFDVRLWKDGVGDDNVADDDPPQQGDRRAAAAAAVLGLLRDPRRGLGRGRPSRRSAARGAGDERGDPARDHAPCRRPRDERAAPARSRRRRGSPTARAGRRRRGRRGARLGAARRRHAHAGRRPTTTLGTIGGGHLELKAITAARAMLGARATIARARAALSRSARRSASAAAAR